MSEIIVQPGTSGGGSQFGLEVLSEQPIRLSRDTPTGPVTAFGSTLGDTIVVALTSDTTSYTLLGAEGSDRLITSAGKDVIIGGYGDDVAAGGGGNDTIFGEAGNDRLLGGGGNDSLIGGSGDDELIGGPGNDMLSGGIGDDTLEGGSGRDRLMGGAGQDTFRFGPGSTGGSVSRRDRIVDFDPVDDTIELSRSLLPRSSLPVGRLKRSDFANVDRFTSGISAKIVYERSTGLVYYNSPSGRDIPLIQLQRNLSVTASDFEIF